jgi:predicted phosphate transport protein (TIGR00153 family)
VFSFWRSEKRLQELLGRYLEQVDASLKSLESVFPTCLDGTSPLLQQDVANPVHKKESIADDIRRELEHELLSGKLLPGSRSEVLEIIEAVDSVPNAAEEVVDTFSIQALRVPPELHEGMQELLRESVRTCDVMRSAVWLLFEDLHRIQELAQEVDARESHVDKLERHLVQRVFRLDIELAAKLQLRDLVRGIASLADRAENVTDRVQWLALKRKP